jgi:YidC/Oxa1 family membrane protein insertase
MFHTFFYEPVYNLLVLFLNLTPDIGIAIILTTLIIKIILLPLNLRAQKSQYIMKELEGELKDLKEKHGGDNKVYTEKMLALYKEKEINPFASIFLLVIQIPIFFALFFVFKYDIKLDAASIYSFVKFPHHLNDLAFGFLDLSKNYICIGILTGATMFMYSKKQVATMKRITDTFKNKREKNNKNNKTTQGGVEAFAEAFSKNMNFQMVYFFPIISGLAAAYLPAALGVYWITSNILNIGQDVYIKKKLDIEGFIKRNSV